MQSFRSILSILGGESTQSTAAGKERGKVDTHLDHINESSKKGSTALHKAVLKRNLAAVKSLCKESDVDVNLKDSRGDTALHIAAAMQDTNEFTAALLAAASIKINLQNESGITPMHAAILSDSAANAILLLAHGATLIPTGTYARSVSPAHSALEKCNNQIIQALIDKNINWNVADISGHTPIFYLLFSREISKLDETLLASLLKLSTLSVITHSGRSILHAAAGNRLLSKSQFQKVIAAVVTNPGDINPFNQTDDTRNTPLCLAARNNDLDKITLLLRCNADPNIWSGSSPLHLMSKQGNTAIAKLLIDRGAALDAADHHGNTALVYAAANGDLELIEYLQAKGLLFADPYGELALKKALLNNHLPVVMKLIELGVNPDVHVSLSTGSYTSKIDGFGSSYAVSSDTSSLSDGDGRDKTNVLKNGDTPLHFAITTGDQALATLCLQKKPGMVNSLNARHISPAALTIKNLDQPMAHLLHTLAGDRIQTSTPVSSIYRQHKTLFMSAVTRGFESPQHLDRFFSDPQFKLSDTQKEIKKAKTAVVVETNTEVKLKK